MRDTLAHFFYVRAKFRYFQANYRININNPKSLFLHHSHGFGEKNKTVCIAPAFVLIGKMRADVAERERAQNRVRYRVSQSVGVGMPDRAEFRFDFYAAQIERSACFQAVNVISEADSEHNSKFEIQSNCFSKISATTK